jgi:glycosyltransferase involved in cell wall biosynthesis
MAAGVPVLASTLGGLPEMVGPDSTLDPTDRDAWAEAIGRLWNDRDLRRRRGDEALARARELFGEDRYYERLMDCYSKALA